MTSRPVVLSLCDLSGVMVMPWVRNGFDCHLRQADVFMDRRRVPHAIEGPPAARAGEQDASGRAGQETGRDPIRDARRFRVRRLPRKRIQDYSREHTMTIQ
jgi:hypothetical protein